MREGGRLLVVAQGSAVAASAASSVTAVIACVFVVGAEVASDEARPCAVLLLRVRPGCRGGLVNVDACWGGTGDGRWED